MGWSVRLADSAEALAVKVLKNDVVIVDVSRPGKRGPWPQSSLLIPLEALRERMAEIPRDKAIVTVSQEGKANKAPDRSHRFHSFHFSGGVAVNSSHTAPLDGADFCLWRPGFGCIRVVPPVLAGLGARVHRPDARTREISRRWTVVGRYGLASRKDWGGRLARGVVRFGRAIRLRTGRGAIGAFGRGRCRARGGGQWGGGPRGSRFSARWPDR